MRLTLTWVFCCLCCALHAQGDEGLPFVRNYSPKEYGGGPQNWAFVQDERGVIYCANNVGVLEYDGKYWRTIPASNRTAIGSLDLDKHGRIYVGATGDFGYLQSDSVGRLQYASLLHKVDPAYHDFVDVWDTYAVGEKVCFTSNKYIFLWDGNMVRVLIPKTSIQRSFEVDERLFVRQRSLGLYEVIKDSLVLVQGGEVFRDEAIYAMIPYDQGRVLVATRKRGFFILDESGARPFPTELDEFVTSNQVYEGIRWKDRFILATRRGGVAIMDKTGKLISVLSKNCGLQDDKVNHVFVDREDGLWMALDNGISRVEAFSPFTLYGRETGLHGIALAITRHEGILYVASGQGVYYLRQRKAKDRGKEWAYQFEPVTNITSQSWFLLSLEDALLAGTSDGIYQIDHFNGSLVRSDGGGFSLVRSRFDSSLFIAGLRNGLALLRREHGYWKDLGRLPGIHEGIRCIVETRDGELWLGTGFQGVLRVRIKGIPPKESHRMQDLPVQVDRFGTRDGIPEGGVFVFSVSDRVVFGTEKGLYRFDAGSGKFTADSTFGVEFTDSSAAIEAIVEDASGNVWISGTSRSNVAHMLRQPDGSFKVESSPFLRLPDFKVFGIYPDERGLAWFAGPDGLIRYDGNVRKDYGSEFGALIRSMSIGADSMVFGGVFGLRRLAPIGYLSTFIRFEFSVPQYDLETGNMFQTYLEGLDEEWSRWSPDGAKEYTRLHEGRYRFKVRAKNVYGHLGREADIEFIVLPPWYRSWWAYGAYVIVFAFLLYQAEKWRNRKSEREKQVLEKIVAERTTSLLQKTEQLEKINLIVRSINSEIEFVPLLRALLSQMRIIGGVERTAVLVRESTDDTFVFKVCEGWDLADLSPVRMTLEESESRYTRLSDEIYDDIFVAKNVSARSGTSALAHLQTPKSMLVMRIRVSGHIKGYLVFDNMNNEDAFDDRDVELLKNLKEHIVSAFIKVKLLDELKVLNEKKNEFLGIAAHDLRSPLNAIVGYSSLMIEELKSGKFNAGHSVEDLEDILHAAQRMVHLIGELLDISAIESGKVVMNRTLVNLNGILRECHRTAFKQAMQKKLTIMVETNDRLPFVYVDPLRISEALDNLVDNAIKYTFPGGQIHISAELNGSEVIVAVRDTGQGLDEEDLQSVFKSFKKLSARPTAGESSTGLGLAIVKKIVEMHEGHVGVISGKGQGSTFSFSIPLRAEATA